MYHIYADANQLYCAFDLHSPDETLSTISACIRHKNLDDSEQTKDKWWQNRISSSYILKSKFHR